MTQRSKLKSAIIVIMTIFFVFLAYQLYLYRNQQKYGGAPSAFGWPLQRLPHKVIVDPIEDEKVLSLREILIRKAMRIRSGTIYYLDFSDKWVDYFHKDGHIEDPPDKFMKRLETQGVNVKKISEAWRKNWGITDSTGVTQGWVVLCTLINGAGKMKWKLNRYVLIKVKLLVG